MSSRVYIVEDAEKPAQPPRLVDATYEHVALRHVSQGRFNAKVASKSELVRLLTAGIRVEYADPLRGETQQALVLESAELPEAPDSVVDIATRVQRS